MRKANDDVDAIVPCGARCGLGAAAAAACGSSGVSSDVRKCVSRWNDSFAKRGLLRDQAPRKEASVRMVNGNCVVTVLGSGGRALAFRGGHPQGYGGFLFAGSSAPDELPAEQRKANADVVDRSFKLKLRG